MFNIFNWNSNKEEEKDNNLLNEDVTQVENDKDTKDVIDDVEIINKDFFNENDIDFEQNKVQDNKKKDVTHDHPLKVNETLENKEKNKEEEVKENNEADNFIFKPVYPVNTFKPYMPGLKNIRPTFASEDDELEIDYGKKGKPQNLSKEKPKLPTPPPSKYYPLYSSDEDSLDDNSKLNQTKFSYGIKYQCNLDGWCESSYLNTNVGLSQNTKDEKSEKSEKLESEKLELESIDFKDGESSQSDNNSCYEQEQEQQNYDFNSESSVDKSFDDNQTFTEEENLELIDKLLPVVPDNLFSDEIFNNYDQPFDTEQDNFFDNLGVRGSVEMQTQTDNNSVSVQTQTDNCVNDCVNESCYYCEIKDKKIKELLEHIKKLTNEIEKYSY